MKENSNKIGLDDLIKHISGEYDSGFIANVSKIRDLEDGEEDKLVVVCRLNEFTIIREEGQKEMTILSAFAGNNAVSVGGNKFKVVNGKDELSALAEEIVLWYFTEGGKDELRILFAPYYKESIGNMDLELFYKYNDELDGNSKEAFRKMYEELNN